MELGASKFLIYIVCLKVFTPIGLLNVLLLSFGLLLGLVSYFFSGGAKKVNSCVNK